MRKIIVIGGGPAGMMAAFGASLTPENKVILLEKNEKLGKKLYITGKGRGNFTNTAETEVFFSKIMTNPRFLYSALRRFSNQELLRFMEEWGLSWKEERGGRVFPKSDHASDITRTLEKALRNNQVEIRLNTSVSKLLARKQGSSPGEGTNAGESGRAVCGVQLTSGQTLTADHVIVATGGVSYPATGSTGDGFRFAQELGLKVTELLPALVPFETKESDIPGLQGLSLRNVVLKVFDPKKKILFEDFGELLFTHFGVSGPLALRASSVLTKRLAGGEALVASIDLKPAIPEKELDERLVRHIAENRRREFSHFFEGLLPGKLKNVAQERCAIDSGQRIGDISKAQRKEILSLLKAFSFTIVGTRGFAEAIITQGGVSVKELVPKSMRAKSIRGLSFAGEVIDVDALTGGYNLQIAFSTGFVAGCEA